MTEPVSKHSPILAGGVTAVTASKTIDTGLRALQSFHAGIQANTVTANGESYVTWKITSAASDPYVKVTLYVWKGGTNHGSAGTAEVNVGWVALGM